MSAKDKMRSEFEIDGIKIRWNEEGYLESWAGFSTLALWTESSLAGLMLGMQRMVGTNRFNLMMHRGGVDSIEGDWSYISQFPTFEEGFNAISVAARIAGWGIWRLVSVDQEDRHACVQVEKSWEAIYQRALGVTWGSAMVAGKLSGIFSKLFGVNCRAEQTKFIVNGDPVDEYQVRPSDQTAEQHFEALLAAAIEVSPDVAVAMEQLRHEVDERKQMEQKLRQEVDERRDIEHALREKLDVIEEQQATIRKMSTPIIQVWDGVLTLPLIGTLSSERASDMMERLLDEISRTRARYVILDLTGVELVDTATADHLLKVIRAVELMGVQGMISGIRPAVAQTVIALGAEMSRIKTFGNLREALRACMKG